MRFQTTLAAAALLLTLSACEREATGQVAAVINGEEITLQEINAEIGAAGMPEGADREAVQQAALNRIIERRLLAQMAIDEGLDETQDYLLRERQLRDALLVQLLGQKAERALGVPDEQEITAFINDNPSLFAQRKALAVDRIVFAMPADPSPLRALEQDHSMQAVEQRLTSLGIEFRREQAQLDSAALGEEKLKQIRSLPAGEPFVIPENGMVMIGVIVGERPVPVEPEQARQIAAQTIRNNSLRDALAQRLSNARTSAEIEYQEGFEMPSSKPGATATPASAK